jgi:SAM-dependent methyltransferase
MTSALYDRIGEGYSRARRPDPRIAAAISTALGDAKSVINVGAGTGSYEPTDRDVLAVEPSDLMIGQRPAGAPPCIRGTAEALPVEAQAFDAAMAILTIHHWNDWRRGLAELRRVARHRVVILTFDPSPGRFWLEEYFPELVALDKIIMPPLDEMSAVLGPLMIAPVPILHDCTDGFLGAYWRRPEAYLDPVVRRSISSFSRIEGVREGLEKLERDLQSGEWRARHARLLNLDALDLGYRLVRCEFSQNGSPVTSRAAE